MTKTDNKKVEMYTCNRCGNNVIVTIDNKCLICNPPNEKEIDTISSVMTLIVGHIRDLKSQKQQENPG